MKWMHLALVVAVLVCLGLASHQYAADEAGGAGAVGAVSFRGTVWQVKLTDKQALDLDARQLARAGTSAAALFERLARSGPVRVLHHLDERPDPDGKQTIGTRSEIPFVISITQPNRETVTVSYGQKTVGLTLNLSWARGPGGLLSIRLHGSLSAPVEKAIRVKGVPENVDITALRNMDMHHCEFSYFGEVALDDPQVVVRVVADPREPDVVYAYVVRMAFSDAGR